MTRRAEPAGIMDARSSEHFGDETSAPLSETLSRVAAVDLNGAEVGNLGIPGSGWVASPELATNEGLIEELLRRLGRRYETQDRAALTSLFLRGYLWRFLVPVVSAFLIDRRIPDPGPENVALSFSESGAAARLAFVSGRFAALPGDPDAAHPDAQVFMSEGELLVHLRDRISTGLPDLFSALRRGRPRRGTRALWSMAADVCAEAFVQAGQAVGREDEACAFAESMLGGPSPLSGSTNYVVLEHEDFSMLTRVRNSCCLYYKVGDGPCFTCPRVSDEERMRRMQEIANNRSPDE